MRHYEILANACIPILLIILKLNFYIIPVINQSLLLNMVLCYIYGKHGWDNKELGRIPSCMYWNEVSSNYDKEHIIFIFGGDKMRSLENLNNRYTMDQVNLVNMGYVLLENLNMLSVV